MSFEKRKADAFLTIKRKEKIMHDKQNIKQPISYAEMEALVLENEEVHKALAHYELNKSTGEVQRVDND
jgi:hypothetical protein